MTSMGATDPDPEVVRWALERYRAFFDKSESLSLEYIGQGRMQDICSNPTELRKWLNSKAVQTAFIGDAQAQWEADLGSRLIHSQKATAVASATPDRKLAASLS